MTNREWVSKLPTIIGNYNKWVKKKQEGQPSKPEEAREEKMESLGPIRCKGQSCKLLEMGTKVRAIRIKPKDDVTGKRLHIDPDLIGFYKQLKKSMKKTIKAIETKMTDAWKGNNKDFSKYLRKQGTTIEKLLFRSMNCDTYNYVKGLRKIMNFKAKIPEYKKLFKKLRFKNKDVADLKIPTNKNVLVFYDPPYFDSCNKTYMQKPTTIKGKFIRYPDNTKLYLDVLNKFKNYSFDQIMIINFTCLMHHLFGEYEDRRYDRQYNNQAYMKRKTAQHIVYSKISN